MKEKYVFVPHGINTSSIKFCQLKKTPLTQPNSGSGDTSDFKTKIFHLKDIETHLYLRGSFGPYGYKNLNNIKWSWKYVEENVSFTSHTLFFFRSWFQLFHSKSCIKLSLNTLLSLNLLTFEQVNQLFHCFKNLSRLFRSVQYTKTMSKSFT